MKTVMLEGSGRGHDDREPVTITGQVWAALLEVARQHGHTVNTDRIIPTADARLFADALQLALDRREIGDLARGNVVRSMEFLRGGGVVVTVRNVT